MRRLSLVHSLGLITAWLGVAAQSAPAVAASPPVEAEIVMIIDGSGSMSEEDFDIQLGWIKNCLCGPSALLPTSGVAAVTIIQFGTDVETEVDRFVVASPAAAAALCAQVSAIEQNGGTTYLVPPLDLALDLFTNEAQGSDRLVVLLTDGGVFDKAEALNKCELLRTMSPPVNICSGRISSTCPFEDDFLKSCANTTDSSGFHPTQPSGGYQCIDGDESFSQLCIECLCKLPSLGFGEGVCGADCDGDGIPDALEPDCDRDGVPDDCEPDCNGDGVPDACEPDCDGDAVPDDCESDCDGNGEPDGCETACDCNANGVPDDCDLAAGTSSDVDGNGVPDECPQGRSLVGLIRAIALEGDPIPSMPDQQFLQLRKPVINDNGQVAFGDRCLCCGGGDPCGRIYRHTLSGVNQTEILIAAGDPGPTITWFVDAASECTIDTASTTFLDVGGVSFCPGPCSPPGPRGIADTGEVLLYAYIHDEFFEVRNGLFQLVGPGVTTAIEVRGSPSFCLGEPVGYMSGEATVRGSHTVFPALIAPCPDIVPTLSGIFAENGCLLVRDGDPAPGGGLFGGFTGGVSLPRHANGDEIAFVSYVPDYGYELFYISDQVSAVVARAGEPAGTGVPGEVLGPLFIVMGLQEEKVDIGSFLGEPGSREVAFLWPTITPDGWERQAIFLWRSDTQAFEPLVVQHVPEPLGELLFAEVGAPLIGALGGGDSENGVIVFRGVAGVDELDMRAGLFAVLPSREAFPIVRVGDPVPGRPGALFNEYFYSFDVNNQGYVVFEASYYDEASAETGSGIFVTHLCQPGAVAPCPADLNEDGGVDGADLGLLLAGWGCAAPPVDLNGDGCVDGADLGLMLAAWGPC